MSILDHNLSILLIIQIKKDIKKHIEEDCPEYKIKCPNSDCHKFCERKKMADHLENDCEYEIKKCKNEGCSLTCRKKNLEIHKE